LSRKNEGKEKQQIVNLFRKNVKGKIANTSASNDRHDGKEGHWLERQMGIKANNRSSSDLFGYEMKKDATKISFGDWSADTYIQRNGRAG
jgi:hypothetical protein